MEPNEEPKAFELIQKAMALRMRKPRRASARYIDALAERYSGKAEDRRPRDEAYADGDAQGARALSQRPRRRDALRRIGDGPAAVGLLAARRRAVRTHGRRRAR